MVLRSSLPDASRIGHHGFRVVLRLAGAALPRAPFAAIPRRIERLRGPPVPAT